MVKLYKHITSDYQFILGKANGATGKGLLFRSSGNIEYRNGINSTWTLIWSRGGISDSEFIIDEDSKYHSKIFICDKSVLYVKCDNNNFIRLSTLEESTKQITELKPFNGTLTLKNKL